MKKRFIIILAIILGWSFVKAQNPGGGDIGDPKYIFAKFDYSKDSIQQGYGIQFTDSSLGSVISWHWDFDDGTYATEQNPVHIFDAPGLYDVCLTVKVKSGDIIVEDVNCKKVSITDKGFNHLGGTVYADLFPVDTGVAYLFQVDEDNNMQPYDTSYFGFGGFYWFYQAEGGKYIVRVDIPETSTHINTYMPTYYGNKELWIDAPSIDFSTTDIKRDIQLLKADDLQYQNNNGFINGYIYYEDSETGENYAAEDITILLIDNENNSTTYKYSNENGVFEFNDINFGLYRVHAEVTGKETVPLFANISANNPETNNIDIIIKQTEVISLVDESEYEEQFTHFSIFPNPARDQVNIQLSADEIGVIKLEIYNMSGQLISTIEQMAYNGNNKYSVDVSKLRKGSYFINIHFNNKPSSRNKILIM